MASSVFVGNVSIVLNTKGEIGLKKDGSGKFSAANAVECYETLSKLAKSKKLPINKYALYLAPNGTEPVLLANRYGNPYIALLAKRGEGEKTRKTVTVLA
jgi:hypothetical protein